jgi:hypothetical protein
MNQKSYFTLRKRTFRGLPALLLATILILGTGMKGWGQTQLSLWNFQDVVSPTDVASNISASNVSISVGTIGFQAGTDDGGTRIGNAGSWNQGDFSSTEKYLQFSITPTEGFSIDLASITLRFGRTSVGPTAVTVQYSLDGFSTNGITILDGESVTSTNANSLDAFAITTGLPSEPITETLTIRVWGHNATGTGNLRFNNFRVFGEVLPLGDIVATPTITPNGGTFYSAVEVSLSTATDGATIYYSTDGTEPSEESTVYTGPFSISGTSETITVKAIAIKDEMDDSEVASADFVFPAITVVSTIADLRAGATDGTLYKLTGEAVVTFAQSHRNQKWIQDETAAILIDDFAGEIDGEFNQGDGITDIIGTLSTFNNTLQFTPVTDASDPFTATIAVEPTVITMNQFINNFDGFESQLVTIEGVSFSDADGTATFSNGNVYEISDGSLTGEFRATFFGVDYIGQPKPILSQNITGILNERTTAPEGKFITARNQADFDPVFSIGWANLQWPGSGEIFLYQDFDVYAQIYVEGITEQTGQGEAIQAWIGFSTDDTDPATWDNWVPATYNTDVSNNDEYQANIGAAITEAGTYYYASRFKLDNGDYVYGGFNGGFWDGVTNVSGTLTVNEPSEVIDWANLQWPPDGTITVGGDFDVYAQVYSAGVTPEEGPERSITAWIGYNTEDTNPEEWTQWFEAEFNAASGNNDEYTFNLGSEITETGVYYYASRFQLNTQPFVYGGFSESGGGFWDGTDNVSGVLTVEAATPENHVTNFAANADSFDKITLTWTDSGAEYYLIKGSTVSFNDITAPVDGEPQADSDLVVNVAAGIESIQFIDLTAATDYYFKIFPYNGTGEFVNYKTDDVIPSTAATTEAGGLETFDNLAITGTSHQSGTFLGQDGSIWTFVECRGDFEITGKAIQIGRNRTPQSNFHSGTISNGIGILNFDYMQAFGTNVNLNVLVNDIVVATVTSSAEQNIVKNSGNIVVNIPGDFVLKFINVDNTDGQVVVDNISWTGYTSPVAMFTGTGDWNEPSNWDIEQVPGPSYKVIVSGEAVIGNDVSVYGLTIDSEAGSSLTIQSNASLTVTGTLTNNAGNDGLILQSDASGTASLIHNTAGVEATVERYIPAADWTGADGWHFLSAPVSGQAIEGEWTPEGEGNDYDFYAWQEAPPGTWLNQKNQENAALFQTFEPGMGYLVAYQQPGTRSFTGTLNSGEVTIHPQHSANNKGNWEYTPGWNLLGNPYPSAIDWSLAERDQFEDEFAYIYNTNKEGGAGYVAIDGTVSASLIPANQGFFVLLKEEEDGEDFTFSNDWRAHGGSFMKSVPPQEALTLRLGHGEYFDETVLRLREGSDFDRDRNDAIKMFSFNPAVPQLFSTTADQVQVAINSVPYVDEEVQFTLGLRAPATGQYSLSLQQAEGAFAAMPLFVQDLLTGTVHNLKNSPEFSFQAAQGDDPARFLVTFAQPTGLNEMDADAAVHIFTAGNTLHLQFAQEAPGRLLQVYDLSGRMVMSHNLPQTTTHTTPLNVEQGVYLVRVIGQSGTHVQKVIIK